jgi:hypothetical protein
MYAIATMLVRVRSLGVEGSPPPHPQHAMSLAVWACYAEGARDGVCSTVEHSMLTPLIQLLCPVSNKISALRHHPLHYTCYLQNLSCTTLADTLRVWLTFQTKGRVAESLGCCYSLACVTPSQSLSRTLLGPLVAMCATCGQQLTLGWPYVPRVLTNR